MPSPNSNSPGAVFARRERREDHSRHGAEREREEKNRGVDCRTACARERVGEPFADERNRPPREQHAHHSTERGQDEAFRQHLPNDAPPSRADRDPDGNLAAACRGSRKHQAGDVRACDQQNAAYRPEKHVESPPRFFRHHPVVGGGERDAPVAVRVRVFDRELPRDPFHLAAGLRERRAWTDAPDHLRDMVGAVRVRRVDPQRHEHFRFLRQQVFCHGIAQQI